MIQVLWFLLGLVAAVPFVFFAKGQGARLEQSILAQGLVIAALIYVGFAALWSNLGWVAIELGGLLIYGLFALLAWRHTVLWLAAGWAVHPLWDMGLHWVGQGHTIAPAWYVIACLAFDLLVAGYILTRLHSWRDISPGMRFGRI